MRSIPDNVIHPKHANTARSVRDEALAGASDIQRLRESEICLLLKGKVKKTFSVSERDGCPVPIALPPVLFTTTKIYTELSGFGPF
jgi:hypothetical protein